MKCQVTGDRIRFLPPSGARPFTVNLSTVEVGPEFRGLLVARFVELSQMDGTWGSESTFQNAATAVRGLFRDLGVEEPHQLTGAKYRQHLSTHAMTTRAQRHHQLRRILEVLPGIPQQTVAELHAYNVTRPTPALATPLTQENLRDLRTWCFKDLNATLDRVETGWRFVEALRDGTVGAGHPDHNYARALDEIARTGDIARRYKSNHGQRVVPKDVVRRIYPGIEPTPFNRSKFALWKALFPTHLELATMVVALVSVCGWNLSVCFGVRTADFSRVDAADGSEPPMIRVKLGKMRRGYDTGWSETYGDEGPRSKVRLLELIMSITEGTRTTLASAGHPTDYLLAGLQVGLSRLGPTELPFTVFALSDERTPMNYLADWRNTHPQFAYAVPRDLRLDFTTQQHMQGHSVRTNGAYHLRSAAVRKAAEPEIEDALQVHFSDIQARILAVDVVTARDIPEASAQKIDAINRGELDTPATACIDNEHHPETGCACRASFLLCFLCKNAIIVPRHLPRIVAIHEHLDGLRRVVAPDLWDSKYAEAFAAVESLVTSRDKFTEAEVAAARASVTAADREVVRLLFDRRWDA